MTNLTQKLLTGVAAIALLTGPAFAESHVEAGAEMQADVEAAGDAVADTASEAAEATGEAIDDAASATAEAANDAMDAASEAADQMKTETADTASEAEETMDTAATEMTDQTAMSGKLASATVGDLVGKNVLSDQGNDVGEIDAVVQMNGTTAAVVGVGGFLGIGEHDVAIELDKIEMLDDDTLRLVGYTEDELEAMPEYDPEMGTELAADAKLDGGM